MLIALTLSIMIAITLFSIIIGSTFTGNIVENVIDNDLIVNGTPSSLGLDTSSLFNVDPVIGFTLTIIVIVALASVIGIQIIGSGLSPESVRILVIGISYTGIWVVFSLLAQPLIASIEIFGILMYVTLTIGYVMGVVQKITGGGD